MPHDVATAPPARALHTALGVVAASLALCLVPRPVRADKPGPTGSVVFVKDGGLWRAPLATPDRAARIADLPVAPVLVRGIAAAVDGSAALIDLGADAVWVDLRSAGAAPVYLPCAGGRLAQSGDRVLCTARGPASGVVVIRLRPTPAATPLDGLDATRTSLVGPSGDHIVTDAGGALWLASLATPTDRHEVAPHVPEGRLWIAPNGQRAVGRYQKNGEDSLFGFRLDGRAARRKLMPAVPVEWSADSTWLAVQTQGAGCVLRAVGGEYKCWDHYRALGLSPDGAEVLLARSAGGSGPSAEHGKPDGAAAGNDNSSSPGGDAPFDLYLAPVAGVRAEHPRSLLGPVLAATLIP